jgi:hypothetical protein
MSGRWEIETGSGLRRGGWRVWRPLGRWMFEGLEGAGSKVDAF